MNYTQCGSALALPYADGIAQTCVTSPPYYGLRDYGTELNPKYLRLQDDRTQVTMGLGL